MSRIKNRKILIWIFKICLSVGLVGYLFWKVDIGQLINVCRNARVDYIFYALALNVLLVPLSAKRWQLMVAGLRGGLSFGAAFRISYISLFFNLALPASVGGDVIRIFKAQKSGVELATAINSVMLERLAVVFGILIVLAIGIPELMVIAAPKAGVASAVLIMAGMAGFAVILTIDRLPPKLVGRWAHNALCQFSSDARQLFWRKKVGVYVLSLSIIGHLTSVLTAWFIAYGIGLNVTLWQCLILLPPVILAMTLPISIAGWGVREAAVITMFGLVGATEAQGLALGVLSGILTTASLLPGGILWLISDQRKSLPLRD